MPALKHETNNRLFGRFDWFHNCLLNIQEIAEFIDEFDNEQYNPKIGFTVDNTLLPDGPTIYICDSLKPDNKTELKHILVDKRR